MFNFTVKAARLAVAATLCAGAATAGAQTPAAYPTKPIRIIVPYGAGGSTSVATRIFAQKLSEVWGQPVIVDNRPGGNTLIGSQAVARAAPDGYTLLTITNTHVINPWLQAKLPYDTFKDFAAVATLTRSDYMLAANPAFPPNTVKELINYAKANPDKVNSTANGLGTVQHLVNELFMDATGVKFVVIPYKSGGQSTTDLIGGQVQVSFNNLANLAPHVQSGAIKGLAISGKKRHPLIPNVPTFAEAGYPGFAAENWFGVLAPAGTPAHIIEKINAAIRKVQAANDTAQILAKQGLEPYANTVAATNALMRSDYERYGKIIRAKGITGDND